MIFVTVGAQMPFDRMVRTVDDWAGRVGRGDVFAQIGPTRWRPAHLKWTRFLDSSEFRRRIEAADAVIAHAGMGSIIMALHLGKPILVMPRRGDLRETRNDHQVATAQRFLEMGHLDVAFDEVELAGKLDRIDSLQRRKTIGPYASESLLNALREFIRAA